MQRSKQPPRPARRPLPVSGTSSGQTTKLAKLAFAVSMRTAGNGSSPPPRLRSLSCPAATAGAPAVMSPGTFNVDNALRSQPIGLGLKQQRQQPLGHHELERQRHGERGERSASDRLCCHERHWPSQRHEPTQRADGDPIDRRKTAFARMRNLGLANAQLAVVQPNSDIITCISILVVRCF